MKKLIFFLMFISVDLFSQESFKLKYDYAKELYLNEQYTRAVFQFDSLNALGSEENKDRVRVGLSASLWMLGDPRSAYTHLNSIENKSLSKELQVALSVSNGDVAQLGSIQRDREYLSELKKLEENQLKSPGLASFYSALVPGLGHAYLGAYQSAAVVFIFSALTGYSTIEFADQNLTGPAIASGVLFSIFYAGGIYSSYEAGVKINSMNINHSKKALNVKYFPILRLDF